MAPMWSPSAVRALCAVILLAGPSSCGSSAQETDARSTCTEIACAPSLRVHFARTRWPTGRYQIEVTADGASEVCQLVVPLACSVGSMCTGQAQLDLSPELSGCALDPGLHAIEGVALRYSQPASVSVRVVQDDRELGIGTFNPSYVTSRPNGPDCLPVCHTAATENLTLVQ
jgi:hypothetical protein